MSGEAGYTDKIKFMTPLEFLFNRVDELEKVVCEMAKDVAALKKVWADKLPMYTNPLPPAGKELP